MSTIGGVSPLIPSLTPTSTTTSSSAPEEPSIYDASGNLLATNAGITALYDNSGAYVGSYGIDPSTGYFSAWTSNGQETSLESLIDGHNLSNNFVPISSDGRAGVLYNNAGQYVGAAVAGYVDTTDFSGQSISDYTGVYDKTGKLLGYYGVDPNDGSYSLWSPSGTETDATDILEAYGLSPTDVQTAVQMSTESIAPTETATNDEQTVNAVLAQYFLNQSESSLGTISTSVYDSSGSYVGSFGGAGDGTYGIWNQQGIQGTSAVALTDSGLTEGEANNALQMLTQSIESSATGEVNLRTVNDAIAAYMLSQQFGASHVTNASDLYDGDGNFVGLAGESSSSGDFEVELQNGLAFDATSYLLDEGLTQSQLDDAQALQSGMLTETAIVSEAPADLRSVAGVLQEYLLSTGATNASTSSLTSAELIVDSDTLRAALAQVAIDTSAPALQTPDGQQQPGVFIGLNSTGVNGKLIPHAFIEIVDSNGQENIFEWGPSNGLPAGGTLQKIDYGDNALTAATIVPLLPPSNTTQDQWIDEWIQAGTAMDNVVAANPFPYSVDGATDCYSPPEVILETLGYSAADAQAILQGTTLSEEIGFSSIQSPDSLEYSSILLGKFDATAFGQSEADALLQETGDEDYIGPQFEPTIASVESAEPFYAAETEVFSLPPVVGADQLSPEEAEQIIITMYDALHASDANTFNAEASQMQDFLNGETGDFEIDISATTINPL